jgi:FkbM family methyltransferase
VLKTILNLLYKILKLIDLLAIKFFNKNFLISLKDLIEAESYKSIIINSKKIDFFIPNKLINWRIKTFFTKEPGTLKWIDGFNGDGKIIFWDIGANIGLYSIYAACVHQDILIYSFEPSSNNLRTLSRNISINNFNQKIKIFNNPLSNQNNKFLTMKETSLEEGGAINTYGENFNYKGEKVLSKMNYQICGNTINYLLDNKVAYMPNYIKLDVDGIEHLILKGGDKYLSNENLLGICVEINENFKDQFENILDILKKNKFIFSHKENLVNDKSVQNNIENLFNYFFYKNI